MIEQGEACDISSVEKGLSVENSLSPTMTRRRFRTLLRRGRKDRADMTAVHNFSPDQEVVNIADSTKASKRSRLSFRPSNHLRHKEYLR